MTRFLFRLSAMALSLPALSACIAVGPDYHAPSILMASGWSNSGKSTANVKAAELAQWWKRFNDPVLNSLIEQAVAGNQDVALAKAKIREARASYQQTGGVLYPRLDGTSATRRSKNGVSAENSNFSLGADTKWELDLFGANHRAIEAARYGLNATQEDMHATLLTLIGDVSTNYIQLRGYQASLALARRTVASQNRTTDLTRVKFQSGAISEADLLNAQGQALSTETRIPDLNSSILQSVHRLSILTGQQPSALQRSLGKSAAVPPVPAVIKQGIPADLLLNRPDLRVAERQYAKSTAIIGQRQAALYPSINLSGSISTNAAQIGDLAKSSTIGWSFGPSLSVPLFNAGQLQASVEGAKAARDQSFILYRKAILNALEEVENASVSLTQQRLKYTKLQQATQFYRKATELSIVQYQNGSNNFLDLLTAQRSLYSAEDTLIQTRVALARDYITLQKALGGGWGGEKDGAIDASQPVVRDGYTGPHLITHLAQQ